jgi:hypothetical protein
MSRYDAGWGRPFGYGGYDQAYRPYVPPGAGFRGGPPPYDAVFRGRGPGGPDAAQWDDVEEEYGEEGSIYGPARYGLGPYYERLRRRRRPDEELKEEVAEALFFDTWVDADAITVEVKDGIVTLRGELPDYDEIRYATDDAWDVDGVRGVHSELTVRGETPRAQTGGAAGSARAGAQASSAAEPQATSAGKGRGRKKARTPGG